MAKMTAAGKLALLLTVCSFAQEGFGKYLEVRNSDIQGDIYFILTVFWRWYALIEAYLVDTVEGGLPWKILAQTRV